MYICICRAVTESQIKSVAGEGACTMRELRHRLGVASQCGKCGQSALRLLRKLQASPDSRMGLGAG